MVSRRGDRSRRTEADPHNLAQYTAVFRVHTGFASFTCGLQNTSSADHHLTARRPSDDSRQMTQILAAQSMSVEESTVSVIRRSSRLIVRSQTAFDRSHPAKLKTRGTFAAPALFCGHLFAETCRDPPAPSAALTPIHQLHVTDLVRSVSFGWWFSYHMLTK